MDFLTVSVYGLCTCNCGLEIILYLSRQGLLLSLFLSGLYLSNLQISRRNQIKVADLGSAKLGNKILGTVCGTKLYMAPEVQEGKLYSTEADMYSFGLMMWEMWFGERVFSEFIQQGVSQGEFLRRIKEENYRPQTPRNGRGFVPNPHLVQWTELMTSCWQTDPSLRKTAAECKEFVKDILKDQCAGT